MKSTVLAIINPKSGTREKKNIEDLLQKAFRTTQHPFQNLEVVWTKRPGHATELAKACAQAKYLLCISVGGDGTMNETATGLLHSETALGMLPLGSGNGLARHIGLSMNLEQAFIQLLTGNSVWMDSATANGKPYFLSAGIGFEGVVANAFASGNSRGFATYISQSLKHLVSYKSLDLTWKADGKTDSGTVFTLTLANGAQYGNNAFIAPGASVRDGQLNLAVLRKFDFWQAPGLIWRLMRNELKTDQYYEQMAVRQVEISSDVPLLGHVDGEPMNFGNRLLVEIVPASIRIQVPIGKQWF